MDKKQFYERLQFARKKIYRSQSSITSMLQTINEETVSSTEKNFIARLFWLENAVLDTFFMAERSSTTCNRKRKSEEDHLLDDKPLKKK